jgi:hypothetical protein
LPGTPADSIDYDSLANLISVDSSFTASVSSGIGGGGCDIKFPEGLDGESIVHDLLLDYTVPAGKNLYINHVYLNGEQFRIDTVKHIYGYVNHSGTFPIGAENSTFNLIAGEGQVLSSEATNPGKASFIGFLVDKANVEPISHSLGGNANGVVSNPTYTVPLNKKLVINHFHNSTPFGSFLVDGIPINYGMANDNTGNDEIAFSKYTITVDGGSVVSIDHSNESSFNGYLVDENYFDGCGGGGSGGGSAGNANPLIYTINGF